MGKIRTRILGLEDVEEKQKKAQKKRSQDKKKIHLSGMKGGARIGQVETDDSSLEKMEKAKKIISETKSEVKEKSPVIKAVKIKIKTHVRGKKYQEAKSKFSKEPVLIKEAVIFLKKHHFASFDESVELHINTDKDGLKGEVELPYKTGKSVKVRIVDDKTLNEIEAGKINFDVLVTHPSYMSKLARFAKVLGPKGLMPNPKAGTISPNPEDVVKKFEKGTIRWKTESKAPIVHQMIGKISHDEKNIIANAEALLRSIGGSHIKSVFVKTTMSPSLKVIFETV